MIKNRPPLSSVPPINKKILSQYFARNLFFQTALFLTGTIFLYKFYANVNSAPLLKTRKSFSFESDPYSGKVSCSFKEVPNYQHGYWGINNDNQSINNSILSYKINKNFKNSPKSTTNNLNYGIFVFKVYLTYSWAYLIYEIIIILSLARSQSAKRHSWAPRNLLALERGESTISKAEPIKRVLIKIEVAERSNR